MKIVIVEDEKNAQEALKKMLQLTAPHLHIEAVLPSVKTAKQFLSNNKIDLLFLDIKLEDGTGFDLLNLLESREFALIFTTAYDAYAIKAFKFSAIDYLLKPIDPSELQRAIQRADKRESPTVTPIETQKGDQKIVLKTADNRYLIAVKDILHLEADGSYTVFYTKEQKIMASKNLKYYEDLLQEYDFVRCHQSHLVAQSHIKVLKTSSLLLVNGVEIPISHRKRKLFKDF
ncbi:LytTR family DNA-binding domain-containing protein [Algoriphagus sp. NG3]|uniref:LytR/AlgR family response regulator transcription factor n=1 Tax=Algoriphagus sp. NG3 TaxID=3097546 RepID=UPI002A83891F|nr:LytTR family DNA-binding domain-containing protein [Algoriphagus sp. NG3]WPR76002.1 LytTR family DNA-binding domain-containing protein [Algoriphagus sp. NG3]